MNKKKKSYIETLLDGDGFDLRSMYDLPKREDSVIVEERRRRQEAELNLRVKIFEEALEKEHQNKLRTIEVFQREGAITDSTKEKSILATFGCNPCVAIAGYAPKRHIGFIIHADSPVDIDLTLYLFNDALQRLYPEDSDLDFYFSLAGGQTHDIGKLVGQLNGTADKIKARVMEEAKKYRNNLTRVFIARSEVLEVYPWTSLALDTHSGCSSRYFPEKKELSELERLSQYANMMSFIGEKETTIHLVYPPKTQLGLIYYIT